LLGGDDSELTVLAVNMTFIRLTYYRREKYRGRRIGQLLPEPFVNYLTHTLKKEISNDNKEKEYQRKNIYVFNRLGYLSICEM